MDIPVYQIDAFADAVFAGNPAAVCPLDAWLPDDLMQAIAAENNLSETAFFVAEGDGYRLRWFTPTTEVQLCGHATLATAHYLFEAGQAAGDAVRFETLSGELVVRRSAGGLEMMFPSYPPEPADPLAGLVAAVGGAPEAVLVAKNWLLVYATEAELAALAPDFPALGALDPERGIIATAPGDEADFVSRFFAPAFGVDEDPVTGSAHCTLIPYWAARLGKAELSARQISRRGGALQCADLGETVRIGGRAVTFLRGTISV